MPLPVRSAALLIVLAAAATGCATPHSTPATKPRAATSTRPASLSPTPTPTASDGKHLKACTDGNCEVLLTHPVDIPVNGHGGLDELSVKKLRASGVDFEVDTGSFSIVPGCTSLIYEYGNASGSSSQCALGSTPGPPEKIRGVLSVQLISVDKDSAIVRLASGPNGRPPSSVG